MLEVLIDEGLRPWEVPLLLGSGFQDDPKLLLAITFSKGQGYRVTIVGGNPIALQLVRSDQRFHKSQHKQKFD
ncbi:hypothetical protein UFOVP346_34 [uncultured Caudovirales phage]|uniref:Uncharacterized protein n=1 Tax=uncultured Caudovirales phage TaxID=2100421 RepID=A0A6J5M2T1_9CAUD|nr:hypothetical protein UFOVP346_34 [uncultured Caudovirales phage]